MSETLLIAGLTAAAGVAGALGRELFGWLRSRPTKAADAAAVTSADAEATAAAAKVLEATGAFQALLNAACESAMADQRREIEDLRAEVRELREAHDQCQSDYRKVEGELAGLRQSSESLARWLQRQGIDAPDLTGARPFIVIAANGETK